MVQAQCYFITGGVRSGKSHFAEQQALKLANAEQRKPYYIASGVAFDEEMLKRISRHREDRQQVDWQTIEQPINILEVVSKIPLNTVVLWDCVTTWLTNELYVNLGESVLQWQEPEQFQMRLEEAKVAIYQLTKCGIPVIIVSNELLDEANYSSPEVQFYRRKLGEFHRWLVEYCDIAIELEYGIPHYWKGES